MSELDEVLNRDTDGKVTWLVSKVNTIDQRIDTIEGNHLHHIEKDISMIKKVGIWSLIVVGTLLTGINLM
tara:strand:+ start:82 stop:291 length:210 start_codon:yes stop_codon:yes gene_type:complete